MNGVNTIYRKNYHNDELYTKDDKCRVRNSILPDTRIIVMILNGYDYLHKVIKCGRIKTDMWMAFMCI